MSFKTRSMLGALTGATLLAMTGAATAQTAAPVAAATTDWRTVAPENLWIIDTTKGRILVELDPRIAPNSVERIRVLTNQGFYDGLKWHRVAEGFMAQTGDPLGTGMGDSELPDLAAELSFRRGRDAGFAPIAASGPGLRGFVGAMPVVTQPDAQMFVTADFKTSGQALFCEGVAGMARSTGIDSANSQFFLMMAQNDNLNDLYTPFGRVLGGMDVIKSLKTGTAANDGAVEGEPDLMIRARLASALPAGHGFSARVMRADTPAFAAHVETARAARGARFGVCDVQPVVEIVGLDTIP